ncbi:EAL domain-containing protein [Skermania sp. ID1734]|uniref:putative bifunctional diguanylate cyclase/phosphodiesterase n=1 Tax=Skermania sp. ID1734 TaxID=2597516 RepID=UPI00117C88ED|nr:GGDEF domain-containing phosphodiesterase [Skermania sp. ID1734]TSD94418.1 EAL domain-containing protein [Skermania sp. ID1734]
MTRSRPLEPVVAGFHPTANLDADVKLKPNGAKRSQPAVATSAVMARTTGALFLIGGLLGFAITLLMPQELGRLLPVYGALIVTVGCGAVLLARGAEMPPRYHLAFVGVATLLITVAVASLTSPVAALAVATFYVFIACDAAFFFTMSGASVEIGLAVVCCLLALGLRGDLPWWSGMITAGATIAVGIVVAILGRLAAEADIDPLTGLLNRRGFDRMVNLEITRATRTGARPAVALVNVDRFSAINSQHGYRTGDSVLVQIADAWRQLAGPRDTIARLGGDEFAFLLPNLGEQEAIAFTDRLRAAISMGCSAGVTSWQPGESVSFLVHRADAGLYRAKQAGRNRTVLESSLRPPLAVELREALQREAIDVYYQPIVSLADGSYIGVEALMRWKPATFPDATPLEVVRAAEENDLIGELDRFVLQRACTDLRQLQRRVPDRPLQLNVNISGLEVADADYAARVAELISETGWPARQLVLEVTESVLDVNSPTAVANLSQLRSHGVRIAIDDFGTGYSSLSRLQTLPSDFLKLDRSFTAEITSATCAPPILEAIAQLSSALQLPVIVEGVETTDQASALTRLGYALAQGYLYGRPLPVDEVAPAFTGTAAVRGASTA